MLLDYWLSRISGDKTPDVTNILDLPEGIKRGVFSAERVQFVCASTSCVLAPEQCVCSVLVTVILRFELQLWSQ